MNARENYRAAERWLEDAGRAFTEDDDKDFGTFCVASAQVHALLAQAATADPTLAVEDMGEYTAGDDVVKQGTEPRQIVIDKDLALRVMIELGGIRAGYVQSVVGRAEASRDGITVAEADRVEKQAYLQWNEYHPALKALWFDVLGART